MMFCIKLINLFRCSFVWTCWKLHFYVIDLQMELIAIYLVILAYLIIIYANLTSAYLIIIYANLTSQWCWFAYQTLVNICTRKQVKKGWKNILLGRLECSLCCSKRMRREVSIHKTLQLQYISTKIRCTNPT
jgi:hypothetical protein